MQRREFLATLPFLYSALTQGIKDNAAPKAGEKADNIIADLYRIAESRQPGKKMIEITVTYTGDDGPGTLTLRVYPASDRIIVERESSRVYRKFVKLRSPKKQEMLGENPGDVYVEGAAEYKGAEIAELDKERKTSQPNSSPLLNFNAYLREGYKEVLRQNDRNKPADPGKARKPPG